MRSAQRGLVQDRLRLLSRLRGLTITEMLVVMGICAALGLLLVPVVLRSRAEARKVVCANNLNGLGQAYTICLTESNNYLPDAYYTFEGTDGTYQVTLRGQENGQPDALFKNSGAALVCPSDKAPARVLSRSTSGQAISVGASYAYNIALPLSFNNASRVTQPVNTVTFYDGDLTGVVGEWSHSPGWAGDTIRYRHRKAANYLFLDGHVENSDGFPDRAFDGGGGWLALHDGTSGNGGNGGWGGNGPGDGGGGDEDPIDITIEDGEVTPNENCSATITCVGAAFQYGAGGPRIPVRAYYRLNGGSKQTITDDVRGGEQVTLEDVGAGDSISMVGKTTQYFRSYHESTGNDGHCWILRDGDVVPSIAGFAGQDAIEEFLAPYMTPEGCLTLGVNDVIFLFELSNYTNYNRYSCADFQDLVVLVSFSKTASGGTGGGGNAGNALGGSININPNNSPWFEFILRLPDGFEVTRDDLHDDDPIDHGSGFHSEYLEYTGPATLIRVKPKGNGNQNSLTLNGEPYPLQNRNRYIITSNSMNVHLYNSKRNRRGKAMGKWWIDVTAADANIEVQ